MRSPGNSSSLQRQGITLLSGESERTLVALGFDEKLLRHNGYYIKAIELCGDIAGLRELIVMHQQLTGLSRPKLFAEIMTRTTVSQWALVRDVAAGMDEKTLIAETLRLEFFRKNGYFVAQVLRDMA